MSPSLLKMLLFNSSFLTIIVGIGAVLLIYLTLLPLIQALSIYDKKKWLTKQFSKLDLLSAEQIELKKRLLESAEPDNAFPMYKVLKFYLVFLGLIGFFSGVILILLPEYITSNVYDKILFLPLILGIVIYFVCQMAFEGHGLWREVSGFFLYLGILSTALMAYLNFELFEWLRLDVLSFLILGIGLFIMFQLRSILVSYLYMLIVTCSAIAIPYFVDDNWLIFLPQLLWVFASLILYFWLPKLRKLNDIGPREIVFAALFMSMVMALSAFQLSGSLGLYLLILVIVLPGLYLFSRAYFSKSSSIFGRPIEVFAILSIVIFGLLMILQSFSLEAKESIFLFGNYSFGKLVSYFILLALIIGVFYIRNGDIEEQGTPLNTGIMWFPLFIFLVVYFLPPGFASFLIVVYLIWMGYGYLTVGLREKSELKVYLGISILLSAILIKFFEFLADDYEGNRTIIGITLMFWGTVFLGLVFYIREKWMVTGPDAKEALKPD
jgi:hypothetical protein